MKKDNIYMIDKFTRLSTNSQKLKYKEYNGEYKDFLISNYSSSYSSIDEELMAEECDNSDIYYELSEELFDEINNAAKEVLTDIQYKVWEMFFIDNLSATEISNKLNKSAAYTINTLNIPSINIIELSKLLKEDGINIEIESSKMYKLYGGAFKKVITKLLENPSIFEKWESLLKHKNC